jgi:hypothetical protein
MLISVKKAATRASESVVVRRCRASAALLKGSVMGLFGLWVAGSTVYNAIAATVPKAELMGTIGLLALIANLSVAGLLYRYRQFPCAGARASGTPCARSASGTRRRKPTTAGTSRPGDQHCEIKAAAARLLSRRSSAIPARSEAIEV